MDGLRSTLLRTTAKGQKYIGSTDRPNRMEHLTCFTPGMLAIGSLPSHLGTKRVPHWEGPAKAAERGREDLVLAKELMETCFNMYEQTRTGIGPERVDFNGGGGGLRGGVGGGAGGREFSVAGDGPWSTLRPEMVESLFILHQITGDEKYQKWGWKVWTAIERYARTDYGYGALPDVDRVDVACCNGPDDRMESYVFAETFKYLYLLFDDDPNRPPGTSGGGKYRIDLTKWVFNTESHPMAIGDGCTGACVPFGDDGSV